MEEVLPGIVHWSAIHPETHEPAHSHFLLETGTLLDPMLPEEGLGWFDRLGDPQRIILTNGLHVRDAERFAETYDCPILTHPAGFHRFAGELEAEPIEPGDEPAQGIRVVEVGVICPDEVALHVAVGPGALAVADGVLRVGDDGELGFFSDDLLGDDPEAVKAGLRAAYGRIAGELDFDVLLLAHGLPVREGGRAMLARFGEGG